MSRLFRVAGLVSVALASALLAGCASPMRGEITTFHQWPADAPRVVSLVRAAGQQGILAHASHESLLRSELVRAGFQIRPEARFGLSFDYQVKRHFGAGIAYQPMIQPWFWWSSFGPHAGFTVGGPFPWWGGGWTPVVSDRIWYDYRLRVWIDDRSVQPPRRVYEATAVSDSYVPEAEEVLPLLARALFTDFPGMNGATRRVTVARSPQASQD